MKKSIPTVIELTNLHIKLFQFKNFRNNRILTACDVRPVGNSTDDKVVETLIGMLRTKNVRADDLLCVIPRRFVILKQMRLPSQNEDEIKKMVELQLAHKTPYPLEDVSYHCHLLDKDGAGHSRVLVIVVHKEVSDRYLDIFRKVGISLNRFTLSSFGILAWLEFQKRTKKIKMEGPVAVVDIDTEDTEICFCHNGKLLFSRSFTGGAKDLKEDNIFGLAKQIGLSLGMYRKEDLGPPVQGMIILSTLDEKELLRDQLAHELQMPVKTVMPGENILCQKNIKMATVKEHPGLSLSAGVGLGLAQMKEIINLAPQKVHDTARGKRQKNRWLKFLALCVLTGLLGAAIPFMALHDKTSYLAELKREVEAIEPKAREALQQIQFIESFHREFGKRVFMSDLLHDLYGLTSQEISFRSLYLNEEGHLLIQGYARTGGSINNFQSALVKSEAFGDVHLQFATKRRIFNTEVMDFKMDMQLMTAEEPAHD